RVIAGSSMPALRPNARLRLRGTRVAGPSTGFRWALRRYLQGWHNLVQFAHELDRPGPPRQEPRVLTVFSDLHCPWAYLFSIRLRRARTAVSEPPVAWRSWPLELVNERGPPRETLSQEIPVLAQLEPDHFAPPRRETWPSTFLPAMEGLKVAGELGGPAAADRFDEAARRAFFLHRRDLAVRALLGGVD